ncbi:MAG: dipeptidase [Armatimonadetes bacterium]|nr:dipeptidase [Armatimonadota bacterium]
MTVAEFIDSRRDQYEKDLIRLLEIPSVSTDSSRKGEVQRCAEEVRRQLGEAGLKTEIIPTQGHPVVLGEWTGAEGSPTLLFYGHYDVQPEDPLEKWTTPPFQPTIRNGKIYARGATDDKGQFLAHVKAVHALMESEGRLPVNVKFVIEGEEEIGSPHLKPFLEANRDRLAADVLVISDSAMFAPGVPSILYALRGLTYLQIDLKGAHGDLHSGVFGGAVPNPGYELCRIIAALKDSSGRCTIPGFYDKVLELTEQERRGFASLPFDAEEFRRSVGSPGLSGEEGFTVLEQRWARPTVEVNGLLCGFTGEGAKTVLPNLAMAKISCRLVPNQDPDEIAEIVERHIRKLCPDYLECTVTKMHGGHPWITPPEHPALAAASRAMGKVFGKRPVSVREGGSIPIVVDFETVLGVPGVLLGFGLNDENLHAPNEHMDLGNYHLGIRTSVELMREMASYRPG